MSIDGDSHGITKRKCGTTRLEKCTQMHILFLENRFPKNKQPFDKFFTRQIGKSDLVARVQYVHGGLLGLQYILYYY